MEQQRQDEPPGTLALEPHPPLPKSNGSLLTQEKAHLHSGPNQWSDDKSSPPNTEMLCEHHQLTLPSTARLPSHPPASTIHPPASTLPATYLHTWLISALGWRLATKITLPLAKLMSCRL